MTEYRLLAEPRVDLDVAAAFEWYEKERSGLGHEFLEELRATYNRVADGPCIYEGADHGIRPTRCATTWTQPSTSMLSSA